MINGDSLLTYILAVLNRVLGKAQDTITEETVKDPDKMCRYLRRMRKYIPVFKKLVPLFRLLLLVLLLSSLYNRPLVLTAPPRDSINTSNSIRVELPDESTVTINDSVSAVDITVDIDSLVNSITVKRKNDKQKRIKIIIPKGKSMRMRLRDGSKVHLNSASTLEYPLDWEAHRDLYLSGEGYFEVTRNEQKAFVVHSKNMDVTALGTSFNIKNYSGMENSEVSVVEGRVLVQSEYKSIFLPAGKKAIINQLSGRIAVNAAKQGSKPDWTRGIYIFQQSSVKTICQDISRLYNINVIIDDPEIESRRFVGMCNLHKPVMAFLADLTGASDDIDYYEDSMGQWHICKRSGY